MDIYIYKNIYTHKYIYIYNIYIHIYCHLQMCTLTNVSRSLTHTQTHTHTHTHSPASQRWPSQPSGQKHWKELMPSMQVPPFSQGDDAQSLMSAGRKQTLPRRSQGSGVSYQLLSFLNLWLISIPFIDSCQFSVLVKLSYELLLCSYCA